MFLGKDKFLVPLLLGEDKFLLRSAARIGKTRAMHVGVTFVLLNCADGTDSTCGTDDCGVRPILWGGCDG